VISSLQPTAYTVHPLQVMLWLAKYPIANHLNVSLTHTSPLPK